MKPENDLDYMELFNKTFLLSPIGMAMMSKEGSWLKVNPAFCHMLGLKETELVETTFQQLVINEHLNSSKPYIKNEIAPQDYSYLEKPIYHKNGLKIWLSFNFTQLDQSNDYLVYIQDITTKKRFEADMIINESSSQIGSWRKNRQTNEITWSTEMYRIFGLDIATEITPGLLLSKVYPGDQEKLLKDIHALNTTHPLRTIFRIIRGDGEVRIIDTHMELLPNEEGEPSIVAGTLQDITERRQQDATLHYHDYLFKLFSEHSEDVIYCLSPDSIVVYVSPTIKKVLGYEPQELIGSHAKSLWHPEDKAVAVQQTMIHSDIYTYDYRVQHKQGHYIWLHTIEKVVRDQEGNIIQRIGIDRDITKRKRTESHLYEDKERLESIIKNNADAIWVVDLEDRVLEINPAFERMFGWSEHEVVGRKLPIIPDDYKALFKVLHQEVRQGKAIASKETKRLQKNGKQFDASTTLSPIYNNQGHIIGINGICRDITSTKKAEAAIVAKNQQIDSFIDNNVDAILIFDSMGNVSRVNQAFEHIFGFRSEEILGRNLYSLPFIPDELTYEINELEEKLRSHQSTIGYETNRLRKDGTRIHVLFSGTPTIDEKGKLSGWWVILRDITEWKKSQELLRNTEKLSIAGQLAAGVAHEIRNPMTSIKGFIQLMTQVGIKREYLKIISSEINRIDQILGELLLLAKPQVTEFKRKNINQLLSQTMMLLHSQAILNNVEMLTNFQESAVIMCDENQLKQVFINMIKNGIEAMPDGGRLIIETNNNHDNQLVISFKDQGIGMSKELVNKLGQPFYTTKEKGTGLGFMVSKKIIENHAGEISVKSELNKGTTIEISLPITT